MSSKSALKVISEKNDVIQKQKETIDKLKLKLNVLVLQSKKSKESTQNNKNNVAIPGTRFSLLRKIESLKDNLKPCKAVGYGYNNDSKNQKIK